MTKGLLLKPFSTVKNVLSSLSVAFLLLLFYIPLNQCKPTPPEVKMLENRPEDALGSLVESAETADS